MQEQRPQADIHTVISTGAYQRMLKDKDLDVVTADVRPQVI